MRSAPKERGVKNAPNLGTNRIDFCGQRGDRGSNIPKLFGRHIWNPLNLLSRCTRTEASKGGMKRMKKPACKLLGSKGKVFEANIVERARMHLFSARE